MSAVSSSLATTAEYVCSEDVEGTGVQTVVFRGTYIPKKDVTRATFDIVYVADVFVLSETLLFC